MNEHDCQDQQAWQDTLHATVSNWIRTDAEHDPWERGDL
jgi:hypothetical protein